MTASAKAIAPLRRWAVVTPRGNICTGWLFVRRADAEQTRREEYPGRGRGARVVRVTITAEANSER